MAPRMVFPGILVFLEGLRGTRDLYHEGTEFRRRLVLVEPARAGEFRP